MFLCKFVFYTNIQFLSPNLVDVEIKAWVKQGLSLKKINLTLIPFLTPLMKLDVK